MVFRFYGLSAALLTIVSAVAIAAPAVAGVPLTWARVRSSTNQVRLVSAIGASRPASVADCFCPGDLLNTAARAQAEVLFNDGSLARLGQRASLQFWPHTRKFSLTQGTAALFVPPDQGRTTVQTPSATVGLNSSGVVVRYVPSRGLTLVMALANSSTGPVSVTTVATGQELVLNAGQMAFVSADSLQVVEFDLLEFYQTSDLMAGLRLADLGYRPPADEPLAALRPALLQALNQQAPFNPEDVILNPSWIGDIAPQTAPQGTAFEMAAPSPAEELRRYNEAPPGVINPLPTTAEPAAPAAPITPTATPAQPASPPETVLPASAPSGG